MSQDNKNKDVLNLENLDKEFGEFDFNDIKDNKGTFVSGRVLTGYVGDPNEDILEKDKEKYLKTLKSIYS